MRVNELLAAAIAASLLLSACDRPQAATKPAARAPTPIESAVNPKLGRPFGTLVKVRGVVFDGPTKGYEGGPNLRIQTVDGAALAEEITMSIRPYFGEFGDSPRGGVSLPNLTPGTTYEMEGYETGYFVGIPDEAYELADIQLQTTMMYFHSELSVIRGTQAE